MKKVRVEVVDRAKKDAAICRAVLDLPELQEARTVMFYNAIGSEPSLQTALEATQQRGKRVLLPRCVNENEMIAAEYVGEQNLKLGRFGILEPTGAAVSAVEIDLVFCPGLAFDRKGNRLGYGGGYYDRFLQNLHAFRVGICYANCIVEQVPAEERDLPMQALICEKGRICMEEERQ